MDDPLNDPDYLRKNSIESEDIRHDEERAKLRWGQDTDYTHLIRTPNDVIEAMAKLECAGLRMQWCLEALWLGDTSDMGHYHCYIHGVVTGPVITEYLRMRHRGFGTLPMVGDQRVLVITKEQVDALAEAGKRVARRRREITR